MPEPVNPAFPPPQALPPPQSQTPATIPSASMEVVSMDMSTLQGMEALQRGGNMLSSSTLVPVAYRRFVTDKDGNRTGVENPSALSNCVVALNMATRLRADVLMVMQNMHIIEGRPSWSSAFIIASINQCGRFSPIRFDLSPPGEEVDVQYKYVEWEDIPNSTKRRPVDKIGTLKIKHQSCRAWVIEKATGQRLDGPEVTMQMAVDEGWVQKKGSKWRTMQEVMLRYRSSSLFGRIYAPELLMGLPAREELEDFIEGEVLPQEPRPAKVVQVSSQDAAVTRQDPGPQAGTPTWSIEEMEAFDDLMDKAYLVFKDSGMGEHYPTFQDLWKPKRGRADAKGTIRDLAEAVAGFTPAKEEGPADAEPDTKPATTTAAPATNGLLLPPDDDPGPEDPGGPIKGAKPARGAK